MWVVGTGAGVGAGFGAGSGGARVMRRRRGRGRGRYGFEERIGRLVGGLVQGEGVWPDAEQPWGLRCAGRVDEKRLSGLLCLQKTAQDLLGEAEVVGRMVERLLVVRARRSPARPPFAGGRFRLLFLSLTLGVAWPGARFGPWPGQRSRPATRTGLDKVPACGIQHPASNQGQQAEARDRRPAGKGQQAEARAEARGNRCRARCLRGGGPLSGGC